MIEVDGTMGEGGGQVIRSSLTFSMVTGTPFKITDVRANRSNPGLAPQHLTAVEAAAEITSADVDGNKLRSSEVIFKPQQPAESGKYEFDVSRYHPSGSAGSTLLILQTVLVPLSLSEGPSVLRLHGGTHVDWSPPYHYVNRIYRPLLQEMGFTFELDLERWGFYPRGGGMIRAQIEGLGRNYRPGGLELNKRGDFGSLEGLSAVANLDPDILRRQTREANRLLEEKGFSGPVESVAAESPGPGTAVYLEANYEEITSGFVAYGKKGKPAEIVAQEAVNSFLNYHEHSEPVDRHLADQLIVPFALSENASEYRTVEITNHLVTNVNLAKEWTNKSIQVEGNMGEPGQVTIGS